MTFTSTMPLISAGLFILVTVTILSKNTPPKPSAWHFPALVCFIFTAFSLWTIAAEGPLGFWPNHIQNLWGNQVWFDLLIAIGIGFYLLAPKAKELGMRLPLWLLFICSTGCIGLLAMLSRYLYLQEKTQA